MGDLLGPLPEADVVEVSSRSAYDGSGFAWFSQPYDRLAYRDRIVVHEAFRRKGVASRVHDALDARPATPPLLTLGP